MKILHIAQWQSPLNDRIFEELHNLGVEVKALVAKKYSKNKNSHYIYSDCKDYTVHYKEFPVVIDFPDMENIIKKEKPDIILANLYYMPSSWRASRLARKYNIPFVLQTEIKTFPKNILLNILTRISLPICFNYFFRGMRGVIAWAKDSANFIKKKYPNLKVYEVMPGVDTSFFIPPKNKKKSKKLRILMNARFLPYKRHKDAISALEHIVKIRKYKDIHITLIGRGGDMQNDIKKLIEQKSLSENVTFLPTVPFEKIAKITGNQDLLLLTSFNEAIGVVVAEAMACGLPVILSDTVGGRGYLGQKTGKTYKTGDIDDLVKKIMFFTNTQKRKEYGDNAYRYIQDYSHKKQAKKYKNILEKLIE